MKLRQLRIVARSQANLHNTPYVIVKGIDNSNEVIPLTEYKATSNYKFLWAFDPINNKEDKENGTNG